MNKAPAIEKLDDRIAAMRGLVELVFRLYQRPVQWELRPGINRSVQYLSVQVDGSPEVQKGAIHVNDVNGLLEVLVEVTKPDDTL